MTTITMEEVYQSASYRASLVRCERIAEQGSISTEQGKPWHIPHRKRKPAGKSKLFVANIKRLSRAIIGVNKDGMEKQYINAYEAARLLKISKTAIYKALKSDKREAGGFMWRYADE